MKRLTVQRRAMRDLGEARAYYLLEAPHMVSEFAITLDNELLHLRRNPETGSPRYGLQLGIPGLRSWPLKKFPYIIFYMVDVQRIVVLRVLHQATNIPKHLNP
jgi:toxin ParE1/3/4